jgi:hypothetical protein
VFKFTRGSTVIKKVSESQTALLSDADAIQLPLPQRTNNVSCGDAAFTESIQERIGQTFSSWAEQACPKAATLSFHPQRSDGWCFHQPSAFYLNPHNSRSLHAQQCDLRPFLLIILPQTLRRSSAALDVYLFRWSSDGKGSLDPQIDEIGGPHYIPVLRREFRHSYKKRR